MQNRLRLLRSATALLYLGPLLAGLGGFGVAIVPVFAGIFLLWLVTLRPQDFPRTPTDWMRPEVLVAFTARGAVQVVLVLACFGMGRGIGGVLGSLPAFPLMLPIGVSLIAVTLARLVWDPSKAEAMDRLLEESLAKIEGGAAPHQGSDHAYAEAVTAPLNGLADDIGEAVLERHLSALRALVDEDVTFDVLLARVQSANASRAGKRALMIMASDGATLERIARPQASLQVMRLFDADPDLISRMAERLTKAVRQDLDMSTSCPALADLAALRAQLPTAANALSTLEAELILCGRQSEPQGVAKAALFGGS